MSNPVRRRFWKQSEGKELKTKIRLPVSKIAGGLKISKHGKRFHYMGNLRDRAKIKETMKHGLGWKNESLKEKQSLFIVAAQDQAIRTNYIKVAIDRLQADPIWRMCKQNNEAISHIVSSCLKLAQKEYKKRHDNVARAIHWNLSGKYGFERNERWYDHIPDSVLQNEDYKMLWDFSVRADHEIDARRPDLLIIDKKENNYQIIDEAS